MGPCVRVQRTVVPEVRPRRERFGTHRAHVRLFPGVRPHVFLQVSRGVERLGAEGAFVRFFLVMGTQVFLQVPPRRESLVAHLANVRLLTRVNSLMVNKICLEWKTLPALITLMVSPDALFVRS